MRANPEALPQPQPSLFKAEQHVEGIMTLFSEGLVSKSAAAAAGEAAVAALPTTALA